MYPSSCDKKLFQLFQTTKTYNQTKYLDQILSPITSSDLPDLPLRFYLKLHMDGFEFFVAVIQQNSIEFVEQFFRSEYLEKKNGILQWHPIHYACEGGHSEVTKFLINRKCNIEAISGSNNKRPIHYACERGHKDILKILLDQKCDIEACDQNNWRPIHFACEMGHKDIVKMLLDHHCNIEAADQDEWRPIHLACERGHKDILKMLLDSQCDIEAYNQDSWRPIHLACEKGDKEIVRMLIDRKCDIEACVGMNNYRPIHFACKWGHNVIVRMLMDRKCDIEACIEDNWRPIHFACERGHRNIAKLLIDRKCDIEAGAGLNNWRPIHFACERGHKDIAKLLVDRKCDVNACVENDWRPIIWASERGYIEIVKILINQKCDIDACDRWQWRPLHWACERGHTEIVKLLTQAGCDIEALTREEYSPMKLAENKNWKEIIEIINKVKSERKGEKRLTWKYKTPKDQTFEEQEEKNLARMISLMGLKCQMNCDHSLCATSLKNKTFQNGEIIGQGSFGMVFIVKGSNSNREFAMKFIGIDNVDDSETKYVENDMNTYVDILKHDHIIQYYGVIGKANGLYVFMEYLDGGSIEKRMKKEKLIPLDEIIHYSKQMTSGIAFLHEKRIIHRDIKPANVLIDKNNNVKLVDFGIGRILEGTRNQTVFARTCCGTPAYMGPEVFNEKPYSFSADIYSLGATIYHMMTGNIPDPEKDLFKVIQEGFSQSVKSIQQKKFEFILKWTVNPEASMRPTAQKLMNEFINYSN